MTHSSFTASLSDAWDLQLDAGGNISISTDLEAIAQNVANECRLFKNDAYFRFEDGTEWFSIQLGEKLNRSLVANQLRKSAESVDGVYKVLGVTFTDFNTESRTFSGKIEFLTEGGESGSVGF